MSLVRLKLLLACVLLIGLSRVPAHAHETSFLKVQIIHGDYMNFYQFPSFRSAVINQIKAEENAKPLAEQNIPARNENFEVESRKYLNDFLERLTSQLESSFLKSRADMPQVLSKALVQANVSILRADYGNSWSNNHAFDLWVTLPNGQRLRFEKLLFTSLGDLERLILGIFKQEKVITTSEALIREVSIFRAQLEQLSASMSSPARAQVIQALISKLPTEKKIRRDSRAFFKIRPKARKEHREKAVHQNLLILAKVQSALSEMASAIDLNLEEFEKQVALEVRENEYIFVKPANKKTQVILEHMADGLVSSGLKKFYHSVTSQGGSLVIDIDVESRLATNKLIGLGLANWKGELRTVGLPKDFALSLSGEFTTSGEGLDALRPDLVSRSFSETIDAAIYKSPAVMEFTQSLPDITPIDCNAEELLTQKNAKLPTR